MYNCEIKYVSEIQASKIFNYSRAWFQRERWKGTGPKYLKIRGKVLYPLADLSAWFESFGLISSTSSINKKIGGK